MADEANKEPELTLSFDRTFCSTHGEVYRAHWPSGAYVAGLLMFEILVNSEKFLEECREVGGCEKPTIADLEAVLDKKPSCCRMGRDQLMQVFLRSQVGIRAKCKGCNRKRIGTPYKTATQEFSHLCFDCVLDNVKKYD